MVDEDAGQLVADGTLHEGRRDGGVDAAGEAADRALVTDHRADVLHLLVDDVDHRPGGPAAGDPVQEVLEDDLAVLAVQHLGVPLHPGEPAVDVLERRHRRAVGRRQHGEAGRRCHDRVAVAHPDPVLGGDLGQQRARLGDRDRGAAVLRPAGPAYLAAEGLRHRLEAVAHAEDRHPGGEDRVGDLRRARLVDRARARPRARSPSASSRASPRPACCAGRSRSRPEPRGPGGR